MASTRAITRARLRSATATMAASRTSENKNDRIRWPPLMSSTKGAKMKKRASAIRRCTAENRRCPNRSAARSRNSIARAVLFVSVTISLSRRCLNCARHFARRESVVKSSADAARALGSATVASIKPGTYFHCDVIFIYEPMSEQR